MEEIHLICEDSPEAVFSAIYEAYERHLNPEITHIETIEDICLFGVYEHVKMDTVKAEKVMRTLHTRFGEEVYTVLCQTVSAGCRTGETDKADAVYHTVSIGLKLKNPARVMEQMTNPYVRTVMQLSRNVGRESHHLLGFLRFEELEEGILFAQYESVNSILSFLMPHFADRFQNENFMILDKTRNLIAVHPSGKDWFLISGDALGRDWKAVTTDSEHRYSELFRYFHERIAIEARENPKLQRNMLPLRFRGYMTEFMNAGD